MPSELHPYLAEFDSTKPYKYLIVGTFPPNREVRSDRKSLTDYFYGNRGSLWKILGKIYPEFDFENGSRLELKLRMKSWQEKYNVGITDTLKAVSRADVFSPDDANFDMANSELNFELKKYVLHFNDEIERIYFTSSIGDNSAFETFKDIMGSEIKKLKALLVKDLPSPSGSSNTAWFNVNSDQTIGLHEDLFRFVKSERPELVSFFQERWRIKKANKTSILKKNVPSAPKGIVTDFKIWRYKEVFPPCRFM